MFVPQDSAVVNTTIAEQHPITAAPAAYLPSEPARLRAAQRAVLPVAQLVVQRVVQRRLRAQTAPAVAARATRVAPLNAVVNMATAAHPPLTAKLDASLLLENVRRRWVMGNAFVRLRCAAAFC